MNLYQIGTNIFPNIIKLPSLELPIVWTEFNSPFEFELSNFYCICKYLQHKFPVAFEHLWYFDGHLEQDGPTMNGFVLRITLKKNMLIEAFKVYFILPQWHSKIIALSKCELKRFQKWIKTYLVELLLRRSDDLSMDDNLFQFVLIWKRACLNLWMMP